MTGVQTCALPIWFRVRYRSAAVSSPGNFDGDADFEILPRPVHGDSRRPEGVCERKASPVAKRKAGDLRRLPQLAHENRALLVQNACVDRKSVGTGTSE